MTGSTREATADGSWMLWTSVGLGVIWIAVLVISLFSPDLVTGSQQEHLPLAALTTWIWGLVGTVGFLWGMAKLRGSVDRKPIWLGLSAAVCCVWLIASVLSLTLPVFETGTDPTRLPFGALVAPVAAALLTALASIVAGIFSRSPEAP